MSRPRTSPDQRALYRCVEPFAVYRDGRPVLYASDQQVFEDDPILKTHAAHFEPASARVSRPRVEQATAAPGELRAAVDPISTSEGAPRG